MAGPCADAHLVALALCLDAAAAGEQVTEAELEVIAACLTTLCTVATMHSTLAQVFGSPSSCAIGPSVFLRGLSMR